MFSILALYFTLSPISIDDFNRVELSGKPPDDYINASHIRVKVNENHTLHYIAAQGPLPRTIADFWKMILENDVECVAMVTNDTEGGKVKCHAYWPPSVAEPFTILDRFVFCI